MPWFGFPRKDTTQIIIRRDKTISFGKTMNFSVSVPFYKVEQSLQVCVDSVLTEVFKTRNI